MTTCLNDRPDHHWQIAISSGPGGSEGWCTKCGATGVFQNYIEPIHINIEQTEVFNPNTPFRHSVRNKK